MIGISFDPPEFLLDTTFKKQKILNEFDATTAIDNVINM
jgi:hypothetical protein